MGPDSLQDIVRVSVLGRLPGASTPAGARPLRAASSFPGTARSSPPVASTTEGAPTTILYSCRRPPRHPTVWVPRRTHPLADSRPLRRRLRPARGPRPSLPAGGAAAVRPPSSGSSRTSSRGGRMAGAPDPAGAAAALRAARPQRGVCRAAHVAASAAMARAGRGPASPRAAAAAAALGPRSPARPLPGGPPGASPRPAAGLSPPRPAPRRPPPSPAVSGTWTPPGWASRRASGPTSSSPAAPCAWSRTARTFLLSV